MRQQERGDEMILKRVGNWLFDVAEKTEILFRITAYCVSIVVDIGGFLLLLAILALSMAYVVSMLCKILF